MSVWAIETSQATSGGYWPSIRPFSPISVTRKPLSNCSFAMLKATSSVSRPNCFIIDMLSLTTHSR
ncbi:hypothetical protein D3C87_1680080 [compost metagenome]